MSTFLIQLRNELGFMDDFCNSLVESCLYQNWYKQETYHNLYTSFNYDEAVSFESNRRVDINSLMTSGDAVIPVGSIEFVQKAMQRFYKVLRIEPINIPGELMSKEFTARNVVRVKSLNELRDYVQENDNVQSWFIKSDTMCKSAVTGTYRSSEILKTGFSEDKYLVSTLVDIVAEWRVFVYRDEIMDCKQYSGSWKSTPNVSFIEKAVKKYILHPPAYTLDVAMLKNGDMAVIEAHNFISCGLYGFNDVKYLPQMFDKAFRFEIGPKWAEGQKYKEYR